MSLADSWEKLLDTFEIRDNTQRHWKPIRQKAGVERVEDDAWTTVSRIIREHSLSAALVVVLALIFAYYWGPDLVSWWLTHDLP